MLTEANIRCFLVLARTLNFTKAAQQLSLTQQSVSQYIARMEKELGFPLFLRSHHSVQLTLAGREYFQMFSEFSDRYQQLYDRCRSYAVRAPLDIGFQDWTSLGTAASVAIRTLTEREPGLEVRFTHQRPGILMQELKKGGLQLIVIFERWAPRDPAFQILPLMETELMILVSPDYPLVSPEADYRTFAREPFIVDNYGRETAAATNYRMQRELDWLHFTPSRLIVMPDREAAYTACELGQGCVLSSGLNRVVGSGQLLAYPTGVPDRLVCVWPRDCQDPAVPALAQLLQSAFQAQAGPS
jgi:DNA-binding transcriptional LysR family regulator